MTLALENVNRIIRNKTIIDSLSLKVSNGECVSILGPSGCGKSTTLRLIAGLDKVTSGKIFIDNEDVTLSNPTDRNIGMVFQSYALFPHLTIYENLALGLRVRKYAEKQIKEKVYSILSIMKISDLDMSYPANISGGQKQRVALSRLILRDSKVYLLDEPMSNLDAQLREDLRPELRRLINHNQKSTLYVTHDQNEAMSLSNRIVLLNKGRVEQIGTPIELYQNPNSIFVARFIGTPKINLISRDNMSLYAIRPENIIFSDEGLKCKLSHLDWLGNNALLHLDSDKGAIRMLCPTNMPIPENIIVTWSKKHQMLFDKNTGLRLEN